MNIKAMSRAVAAVVLSANIVWAAEIPSDLLDLDFQRCAKDCIPGYGEAACNKLCACTVGEFKKRLDFSAYLDLSAELAKATISEKSQTFLGEVAGYCTAELDKSGIAIKPQEAP